jgi:hypothetical protein
MLAGHSRVVAPPELHLFAYPDFDSCCNDYPLALKSLASLMSSLGFSEDEAALRKRFAGWTTEKMYAWLLARCEGQFLVDKTPRYGRTAEALRRAEVFKPFYIWLIRHPLGVAASRISLDDERRRLENAELKPFLKYPLYRLRRALTLRDEVRRQAEYWKKVNTTIGEFLEGTPADRKTTVHYERLVEHPEVSLKRLCDRLGIEFEKAMLQIHDHKPVGLRWGIGDGKLLSLEAIDPTLATKWQSTYDVTMLDREILAQMGRLGIPVPGSTPAAEAQKW